jgi:hypothetical protein
LSFRLDRIGGGQSAANQHEVVVTGKRTVLLCCVVSSVVSVVVVSTVPALLFPGSATAQSSQLQEVRASAFTLVGEDGTVLTQLAPAPTGRAGRLSLRTEGTERVTVVGTGILNVYDPDGTTVVFRAGRSYTVGATTGLPPTNGVELGPGGSLGLLESR